VARKAAGAILALVTAAIEQLAYRRCLNETVQTLSREVRGMNLPTPNDPTDQKSTRTKKAGNFRPLTLG
jgi:hypothetical protein